MKIRLTLWQKGMLLAAVPIVLQCTLVGALWQVLADSTAQMQQIAKMRRFTVGACRISAQVFQNSLIFLLEQYQSDFKQKTLYAAAVAIPSGVKKLEGSLPERNFEHASFDVMKDAQIKWSKIMIDTLSGYETSEEIDINRGQLTKILTSVAELRSAMRDFSDEGLRNSKTLVSALDNSKRNLVSTVAIALFVEVLAIAIMASYFSTSVLGRIQRVRANALLMGAGQPLKERMPPGDEITELDAAFHRMVATLTTMKDREHMLIDNLAEVVCCLSEEARFVTINPACASVWGWSKSELIGRWLSDIIPADQAQSCITDLLSMKESDLAQPQTFEIPMRRPDGTTLITEWIVTWVRSQRSLFCVVHDVTAQQELENMRQEFVAQVSHDLRTPLTSVQLSLDMLLAGVRGPLPEEETEAVNLAYSEIGQLINLINDLLDLEKLESRKLSLTIANIDVDDVINEAIQLLTPLSKPKKIDIKYDPCDIQFSADGDRLSQVIANIMSNCIERTGTSGEVHAAVRRNGNVLEIVVVDDGPVASEILRDSMFDRFLYSELEGTRASESIKLALTQRLVELHGGTIEFDTIGDATNRFRICLPFHSSIA